LKEWKKQIKPKSSVSKEELTNNDVPKELRQQIWKLYFDDDEESKCPLCEERPIYKNKSGWHCAHIVAKIYGGNPDVYNLVPLCSGCNNQMGTKNLLEFVMEGKWIDNQTEQIQKQIGGHKLITICNKLFEVYQKCNSESSFLNVKDFIQEMLGQKRYPKGGVPAYITNHMLNSIMETKWIQEKQILQQQIDQLNERISILENDLTKNKRQKTDNKRNI
jgi:ribosomal protein L37AE/L43A